MKIGKHLLNKQGSSWIVSFLCPLKKTCGNMGLFHFISLHSKYLLFILSSFKSVNKNFECSDMKKYYGSEATKTGARNYARKFYSSKAWERKSKAYRKAHPLCERCLKKGIYTRSTCVHHKTHIDQDNYRDVHILFGDSNLEALCDLCHAQEHSKRKPSFEFDENGMLIGCGREDDECKKEHGKKESIHN